MKNSLLVLATVFVIHHSSFVIAQGSLTLPGAPAPTMKTLDEIEPRVPIDATHPPGDDDSIYKVTQPGSYYLTANVAGVTGKMGIEIAVAASGPGVSIELIGFELVGVTGPLESINVTTNHVRNVAVRGWGGSGVSLSYARNNLLADLRVDSNGGIDCRPPKIPATASRED